MLEVTIEENKRKTFVTLKHEQYRLNKEFQETPQQSVEENKKKQRRRARKACQSQSIKIRKTKKELKILPYKVNQTLLNLFDSVQSIINKKKNNQHRLPCLKKFTTNQSCQIESV